MQDRSGTDSRSRVQSLQGPIHDNLLVCVLWNVSMQDDLGQWHAPTGHGQTQFLFDFSQNGEQTRVFLRRHMMLLAAAFISKLLIVWEIAVEDQKWKQL